MRQQIWLSWRVAGARHLTRLGAPWFQKRSSGAVDRHRRERRTLSRLRLPLGLSQSNDSLLERWFAIDHQRHTRVRRRHTSTRHGDGRRLSHCWRSTWSHVVFNVRVWRNTNFVVVLTFRFCLTAVSFRKKWSRSTPMLRHRNACHCAGATPTIASTANWPTPTRLLPIVSQCGKLLTNVLIATK